MVLPQLPVSLYSSPDGSCLLVAFLSNGSLSLCAYHWSTFGHSDGIILQLPGLCADSHTVTSLGARTNVYCIGLDAQQRNCNSFQLTITCKTAEFNFCESSAPGSAHRHSERPAKNVFLDCFYDVWTRFPVVPTLRHDPATGQRHCSISFVSSAETTMCQIYLKQLVLNFVDTTKKPGLVEPSIHGVPYEVFQTAGHGDVPEHPCGQWLVNLLCLIPIHVAVAWENQFVPLKDGVWSREFDQSLLGATVEQIVDELSFGWYESIFKSYMGSKVGSPILQLSFISETSLACPCRFIHGYIQFIRTSSRDFDVAVN